MGARGPKPLPSNVHALRGNASKKALGDLVDDVQPLVESPTCPAYLLPTAKKEWKRITPLLEELGLIAKIDMATLATYCASVAWFEWHERHLQAAIKKARTVTNSNTFFTFFLLFFYTQFETTFHRLFNYFPR